MTLRHRASALIAGFTFLLALLTSSCATKQQSVLQAFLPALHSRPHRTKL